jgi:hypothetical protein
LREVFAKETVAVRVKDVGQPITSFQDVVSTFVDKLPKFVVEIYLVP